jgi:hypothetical protein
MANAQLRRMINEPTTAIYTDNELIGYLSDAGGDYNAVASVIWMEKAAALQATMYDYSTEGERFTLSQVIDNANNLSKYFNSRRNITSTQMLKAPVDDSDESTIQTG